MTHIQDENREGQEMQTVVRGWILPVYFSWWKASPLAYFRGTEGDGLRLSWARNVNTRLDLMDALKGPASIIEGDVRATGLCSLVPVMGNNGPFVTDIKLQEWLRRVKKTEKGVKLHFATGKVIESAVEVIRKTHFSGPMILSADIFSADRVSPVRLDRDDFLKLSTSRHINVILCLGWAANISRMISEHKSYSDKNVLEMAEFVRSKKITAHIMYSMHAVLLTKSIPQAQNLLALVPNSSLYVWTDEQNPIGGIEDLLTIRMAFDISRVFYSIPSSQLIHLCLPSCSR